MPLKFEWKYNKATLKLSIDPQKTVVVKNDKGSHYLPPSLGSLDIYKSAVHSKPLIALNDGEATWFNFSKDFSVNNTDSLNQSYDYDVEAAIALKVFVGDINVLTGEKETLNKLQLTAKSKSDGIHQNYMVIPGQPWLDGFKTDGGDVLQFIAKKLGSGLSAEELLEKTKAAEGGLSFVAIPIKEEHIKITKRKYYSKGRIPKSMGYQKSLLQCYEESVSVPTMGLGMGGRIKQDIIRDRDERGVGRFDLARAQCVHLDILEQEAFAKLMGLPNTGFVKQADYAGVWFDYSVSSQNTTSTGKTPFTGLPSAIPQEEPSRSKEGPVVFLGPEKKTSPFVLAGDYHVGSQGMDIDEEESESGNKMKF